MQTGKAFQVHKLLLGKVLLYNHLCAAKLDATHQRLPQQHSLGVTCQRYLRKSCLRSGQLDPEAYVVRACVLAI